MRGVTCAGVFLCRAWSNTAWIEDEVGVAVVE
jgi:hypothetical protein